MIVTMTTKDLEEVKELLHQLEKKFDEIIIRLEDKVSKKNINDMISQLEIP